MEKRVHKRKSIVIIWVLLVIAAIVVAIAVLNRVWIYDWYRGIIYQPTVEVAEIRDKLDLTEKGKFLFNAAQPELNDATDFNSNCRKDKDEAAVLGCYTQGNIYIYNITDERLAGIRELTAAHELLHAVWARMSENERRELTEPLTRVFDKNQDLLGPEIGTYDITEKQEELYVRAGTEVKDLPEVLEKHFAEIFKEQDKVVDFYEGYIVVFREMKAQMERLASEIEMLRSEIDTKMAEYESGVAALDADIAAFNSCAETAGCFMSEGEFYAQRNVLIARENTLDALNDEINNLINIYNTKVNEYNADATESRKLQNVINSKAENIEIK